LQDVGTAEGGKGRFQQATKNGITGTIALTWHPILSLRERRSARLSMGIVS